MDFSLYELTWIKVPQDYEHVLIDAVVVSTTISVQRFSYSGGVPPWNSLFIMIPWSD